MTASSPARGTGAGRAWRDGLRSLRKHTDAVLLPLLAAVVGWAVAEVLVQALLGAVLGGGKDALVAGVFAFFVLGQLFWAVVVHRALLALGTPARPRPGAVLATALVAGAGLTLGTGLCLLPGLVLAVLGQFTMTSVVAAGRDPFTAFGHSVRLVVTRPGPVLGLTGLAAVTLLGGLLLGIVGVFPAIALVALAQLHLARDLCVTG